MNMDKKEGTIEKRQVSTQIEEKEYKRMVEIRNQTGIPISRQMNLKLKGYKIVQEIKEE